MKHFHNFTLVKQPLEQVWRRMRDHLPDIAQSMHDIESIEVLERADESEDCVRIVNRWTARKKIPAALQSALGAATISWIDRALWRTATHRCEWSIEPSVLSKHIACSGTTVFEEAMSGRGTRVTFDGQFEMEPGFLAGFPGILEPMVGSFLEAIVSIVIPQNLSRAVSMVGNLSPR